MKLGGKETKPMESMFKVSKFGILAINNSMFSTTNQFPDSVKVVSDLTFCKDEHLISFEALGNQIARQL